MRVGTAGALACLAVLCGAVWAQEERPEPKVPPFEDAPPPKVEVRALFQITADPESGLDSVGSRLVNSLLQGELPGVSVMALRGEHWIKTPTTFEVHLSSRDEGIEEKQLAKGFEHLRNSLEKKLRALETARSAEVERVETQRHSVERLAAELQERQHSLQKLAMIHNVELDPAVAAQQRARLAAEAQSLDVELVGLEARRKVIEQQISEMGKKVAAAKAAPSDATLEHLKQLVELRRVTLDRYRTVNEKSPGTISQAELNVKEVEVAEAQAELERYRQMAIHEAGGRRIAELQQRLEDTEIEIAETTAKRRALQEELEKTSLKSDIEMKRIELELLKENYLQHAEALNKAQARLLQYVPPTVTLIPLDSK